MRILKCISFVLGIFFCTISQGKENISYIALDDWLDDSDSEMLYDIGYSLDNYNDPDTLLSIGGYSIPIKRYEGRFKDRKASGFGRLFFGALESGQHAYLPVYYGGFENGLPNGYGELSNYGNDSLIKGNFFAGLPDGVSEIFFEGRRVFRINLKAGVPSDGPVQVFRYPDTGSMPSSVFNGAINGSKISGNWSPLPWTATTDLGQITAFNNKSTFINKDGTYIECIVSSYETDKLIDIKSVSWNMPYKFRADDPQWAGKRVEVCTLSTDGWTFGYRMNRWTSNVDPIFCKDPSGRAGTFSFQADKSARCDVTFAAERISNNFFAKIWREVQRTPNNVKQAILHPITEIGEEFEKFICGTAGKEPGKNCSVSIHVGTTFDIPDNRDTNVEATTARNLVRANEAKNAIGRIANNSEQGAVTKWAQVAAQIYELCAVKCQNDDRREYSLQRILQIEAELKSGFDADLRYRRIASLDPELLETIDHVSQYIPVASSLYQAWRGSQHLDRLKEAKDAIENLPAVDFLSETARARQKAIVDFNRIGFSTVILGEIAPGMVGAWKESFEAMFPSIPTLPGKTQYAILMGLGLNVQEFLKVHKEATTADSWIEAVISEKLKPLGAKVPQKK